VVLLYYPDTEPIYVEELEVTTNPLLWEIVGETPSYLYGSIHLADERIVTLPDVVIEAIDSCDVVYTEIALDADTLSESAQKSTLPSNVTLYDLLPENVENKFNNYIESNGYTKYAELLGFSSYKVWFAASSLTVLENFQSLLSYLPLDYYIWNLAINKNKEARGLEPIEVQLDIFDTLPLDDQIKLLNDTLDALGELSEQGIKITETFISSYLKGNLQEINNLSYTGYNTTDLFYEKLLEKIMTDRNINMSEEISKWVKENPDTQYFFTIGSGHFYGETGILQLLKDEGLTISRVIFDTSDSCDPGEIKINQRCYEPYVTK
jgi:hypothetical protein